MAVDISEKSLVEKLGLTPFTRTAIVGGPSDFIDRLGRLPTGITIEGFVTDGKYALIQYFTPWREDLEKYFAEYKNHLFATGALWISWPKKSSGLISNTTENVVREIGLKNGMVDVKVISIDRIWSGLKFVFRLSDRTKLK